MEDIEWKDIEGFEGIYQISNTGLVKSLERNIVNSHIGIQKLKVRILKPDVMKDNYLRITLSKDGKISKYPIHVLVARAFIDNPNNLPIINHKDENRSNNYYTNLEWCSPQYNLEYSLSRHYIATDPNGNVYDVFNLSQFCKDYNLSISAMSQMATGRIAKNKTNPRRTHKGWVCKYVNDQPTRGVLKHDC